MKAFRDARRAGVPLLAIETADPAATIQACIKLLNGKKDETPVCQWNLLDGLTGMNKPGSEYAREVAPDGAIQTGNPSECLLILTKTIINEAIVFFHNAHRFVENEGVSQGICNCRDILKGKHAMLVLLAPAIKLPSELARDVVVVSEALPDKEALGAVLDSITSDAGLEKINGAERPLIIDTLLGLSAFEAEQATALSISKAGVDRAALWDRKVKAIEQTQGLSVYRGKETFADVGGLQNAKEILGRTIKGKNNISAVCLVDEADKAMAASSSDTSGTTADQLKSMLTYMSDNDVLGMLMLGPPGTAKTTLAKTAANEHGIPLIMLDLGGLKGSLVGQSEQNMRQALKVIHAVSNGRALFIGACNRVDGIPPELRRRFSYASMFVDLPQEEERTAIWKIWIKKYNLTKDQCDKVNDSGWTGSEIRNACLKAWSMDCTLSEAAMSIVPVSKSAADIIQGVRKGASGRFISASKPGLYEYSEAALQPTGGRKIQT